MRNFLEQKPNLATFEGGGGGVCISLIATGSGPYYAEVHKALRWPMRKFQSGHFYFCHSFFVQSSLFLSLFSSVTHFSFIHSIFVTVFFSPPLFFHSLYFCHCFFSVTNRRENWPLIFILCITLSQLIRMLYCVRACAHDTGAHVRTDDVIWQHMAVNSQRSASVHMCSVLSVFNSLDSPVFNEL